MCYGCIVLFLTVFLFVLPVINMLFAFPFSVFAGEKPYPCTICHKRFAQSSHLNSHRRIHAGDRPFFCVICNTGFSQKHRFDAHLPCMQQAKSRSSARISAAVSSAAGMAAATMAAYNSSGSGGVEGSMEVEQKPDVRYLETLNQQALMQQLAEFSAASDSSVTGVKAGQQRGGLEEGEIGRDHQPSGGGATPEETKGNMSAACMPALSSHRRKPAFIRHVDSEEGGHISGFNRDGAVENFLADEHPSLSMDNSGAGFEETENNEPGVSFQNGFTSPKERLNNGRSSGTGAMPASQSLLPTRLSPAGASNSGEVSTVASHGRANHRISLVNFTAEELLNHLMSRSDIHRCDFCRLIFQDAAMYHIHRNMHDKNDLRCCNFCGKMLQDKYDFIAHFLNEHR